MIDERSLIEKLGGDKALEAVIAHFYNKVIKDERINHFFTDLDLERQRNKLHSFLTYAFGGAHNYSGKSIREAHQHLVLEHGLNEDHFDAIAENLEKTLEEMDVPNNLITAAMIIVNSKKSDIFDF